MSGHGHGAEVPHDAEDPFTKKVALSVAVYAVGLAIASFGGHNVAKEMMLTKQEEARVESIAKQDETKLESIAKQEEFNVWTQYQAKSTREALYRNERNQLEAEKKGTGSNFPPYKDELLKSYVDQEKRMASDKEELKAKAESIHSSGEKKVHDRVVAGEAEVHKLKETFTKYQRKDPYFDFAEVAFQLAIVMASVAMLGKKWWAFVTSIVLAVVGMLLTVNGFTLLMAIPGIEHGGGSHGH